MRELLGWLADHWEPVATAVTLVVVILGYLKTRGIAGAAERQLELAERDVDLVAGFLVEDALRPEHTVQQGEPIVLGVSNRGGTTTPAGHFVLHVGPSFQIGEAEGWESETRSHVDMPDGTQAVRCSLDPIGTHERVSLPPIVIHDPTPIPQSSPYFGASMDNLQKALWWEAWIDGRGGNSAILKLRVLP